MSKISVFTTMGELYDVLELNEQNMYRCMGMKVRMKLRNGMEVQGFTGNEVRKDINGNIFIEIWNYKHLNEVTHTLEGCGLTKYDTNVVYIYLKDIIAMEAISYTHPRWGGLLTNYFVLPYTSTALQNS